MIRQLQTKGKKKNKRDDVHNSSSSITRVPPYLPYLPQATAAAAVAGDKINLQDDTGTVCTICTV